MEDNPTLACISEEAARWFVRLKDGDLTAAERREYLHWLKQSPVNVAEMLRMSGVFSALRGARLKESITLEDADPNIVELRPRAPMAKARTWKAAAAVAGLGLATVAVMLALGFGRTIETGAGEWRGLTLEDGSFVRLGPRTRLEVKLDDTGRSIELSRGEAAFQVAKDPGRPFVVNAGLARVRAVGTAFAVVRDGGKVVVTVSEGAVTVAPRSRNVDPAAAMKPLSAGEQISVSSTRTSPVQRVDVARELAWAEGRLIFDDETLEQAIGEFNRRNRVQIEIADSQIAARPVRGVFDAADPESFVDFLATAARVEVVRRGGHRLLLKEERGDESAR